MCLLATEIEASPNERPAKAQPTDLLAKSVVSPILLWILASAFLVFMGKAAIAARAFPDPDDVMRLLEVRDWIAGQNWFDVTQYRLNGTTGVAMHWSRLVDVPIAAVILIGRPLLGGERAETLAIVLVPLLTLGIAMLLVHRIALKLLSARAALAAVAATPLSLGALKQMRPMRIDHHGWQIVMALVGLLACLDPHRRRAGLVAGAAMAVWLNISLEGLPYAASIGALFAWQWLRDGSAAQRLECYLAALATSSLLIFEATHAPSTWLTQQHDVVTVAYLAGFATASISIFAIVRAQIQDWRARLAALALTGLVTLSAMFLTDAHWMVGPFSSLDPLVRTFWYERVDEGLPMWHVAWNESAMGLAQPIVGLIGACFALRDSRSTQRQHWAIYLFMLLAMTLSSVSVLRIATTASVLAMPGTAFLCQRAFRKARAQRISIVRVFATVGALSIMTPAYALPAMVSSSDERIDKAVAAATQCEKGTDISRLQALAPGEIAAPLEITPAILLHTAHRAIATGHHRNVSGMNDTIRLFIEPTPVGEAIIKRRHVDYVVMCMGSAEAIRYSRQGPRGLAAALLSGKPPRWLQPIPVPGLVGLGVWTVHKDDLR